MNVETDGARWAVDQLQLANLVAKIAHIADSGDLDEYATCFAYDAEWWPPETPGVDVSTDPAFGIEAILKSAQDRRDRGVQGPGTNTRHVVSTSAFTIETPGRATGLSYWRYYTHTNETPLLVTQGEYHDEFVRVQGHWRLQKRKLLRG